MAVSDTRLSELGARMRDGRDYNYEYFTEWVQTHVLRKDFREFDTKDSFIDAMEKIRTYCAGNEAGQHIYRTYFDDLSPTTPVDDANIRFRSGVEAEKAWDDLIKKEEDERLKKEAAEEADEYTGTIKDIDAARTPEDIREIAKEIRERDDWRAGTKKKAHDYLEQEAVKKRVIMPLEMMELEKREFITDFRDAQQVEGRYKEIKKGTPARPGTLIDKKNAIKRILNERRKDPMLKRFPDLKRYTVPLGEAVRTAEKEAKKFDVPKEYFIPSRRWLTEQLERSPTREEFRKAKIDGERDFRAAQKRHYRKLKDPKYHEKHIQKQGWEDMVELSHATRKFDEYEMAYKRDRKNIVPRKLKEYDDRFEPTKKRMDPLDSMYDLEMLNDKRKAIVNKWRMRR